MPAQYNYDKSTVTCLVNGVEIKPVREDRKDNESATYFPFKQIRGVRYIKNNIGCCQQSICILINDTWHNIPLDACGAIELYNSIRDVI
jgi:hypothetical protein